MTTIPDKLRTVREILDTLTISTDLAVSGLSKKALDELPDPKDVARLEHVASHNADTRRDAEAIADDLKKQHDKLAAVIRRLREIGFYKGCIFCRFKERELRKAPR